MFVCFFGKSLSNNLSNMSNNLLLCQLGTFICINFTIKLKVGYKFQLASPNRYHYYSFYIFYESGFIQDRFFVYYSCISFITLKMSSSTFFINYTPIIITTHISLHIRNTSNFITMIYPSIVIT